jgi:hypothetical protein
VRYVVEHVKWNFWSLYTLEQDIAIDESLVKFCRRLSFVQFNPLKRARFGLKYYKMYESSSGYCLQFRLYRGKKVGDSELPSYEAVVMDPMAPYLSERYTLYIDNWYSSQTLLQAVRSWNNFTGDSDRKRCRRNRKM